MENQANAKKTILNYGLYLGGASILVAAIKYGVGMQYEQEWYSGVLGLLILIGCIVLGIKNYKSNNNNLISFGKTLKIGLGITFIGTILIIAYYTLFSTVIEPTFVDNTIEAQKTIWADNFGMTQEQIEQSEKTSRDYFYLSLFGGMLIMNFFLGGVTSLIAGAVMKNNEEDQY